MTSVPVSPLGRLLPRRAQRTVDEALQDTRVVLVNGARQSATATGLDRLAGPQPGLRSVSAG